MPAYALQSSDLCATREMVRRPVMSSSSAPSPASTAPAASAAAPQATPSMPASAASSSATAPNDWVLKRLDHRIQSVLYDEISAVLNSYHRKGLLGYIQQYGALSAEHRFGEHVWHGLGREYDIYPFRHLMDDVNTLEMAWFLLPQNCSKDAARLPPRVGDHRWYPTVCTRTTGGERRVACQHMLMEGTRPWWVHEDRIAQARPLMDVMRNYSENPHRIVYELC